MILSPVIVLGHLLTFASVYAQGIPYCAQYSDGASLDCSFSSLSMCEQSVSGVGGICILNPRGAGSSSANVTPQTFDPSYVPPPPPIQSLSNDLSVGSDPPATLGAITFNSDGSQCIGLFRRMSCGGP
jgi:Protein of unknown function (DUF3551)